MHVASSYAAPSLYDSCIFKSVHATKVFLNFPQQLAFREQRPASMFNSSSGQVFQNSQTVCFCSNMGRLCKIQLIINGAGGAQSMFVISFKYFIVGIGNMCD